MLTGRDLAHILIYPDIDIGNGGPGDINNIERFESNVLTDVRAIDESSAYSLEGPVVYFPRRDE